MRDMAEKVNIPLPDITCEDFESSWIRFELVAAAKEWSQEKQALILPTLLRGKLVECYVELEADTKKAVNYVKEELVKRLRLCREPLEAGKLFMTRSQLERERVTEFAMQLKKLFKQAYPEENSTSGILLQRFVMGLKTPVSRQLLLRGKPDTFENAIEAAREIELVLEFESKPMELNAKISSVEDCDTGLLAALKDLTERLGNMEAQIQSVVQCSVAAGNSKTRAEARGTEQEAGRRHVRPVSYDDRRRSGRMCCFRCGEEGHIKRFCPLNFNGPAGTANGSRLGAR